MYPPWYQNVYTNLPAYHLQFYIPKTQAGAFLYTQKSIYGGRFREIGVRYKNGRLSGEFFLFTGTLKTGHS